MFFKVSYPWGHESHSTRKAKGDNNYTTINLRKMMNSVHRRHSSQKEKLSWVFINGEVIEEAKPSRRASYERLGVGMRQKTKVNASGSWKCDQYKSTNLRNWMICTCRKIMHVHWVLQKKNKKKKKKLSRYASALRQRVKSYGVRKPFLVPLTGGITKRQARIRPLRLNNSVVSCVYFLGAETWSKISPRVG